MTQRSEVVTVPADLAARLAPYAARDAAGFYRATRRRQAARQAWAKRVRDDLSFKAPRQG